MGLDMYLHKHIYIGADYPHNNVKGKIELTRGKNDTPIKINFNKVSHIVESVGYWRKANAIHNWFVQNCQDGADDCKEYYVSFEQLKELKRLCESVLLNRDNAKALLPTTSGFFFGDTLYNDSYFEDIQQTIDIITPLIEGEETIDSIYYSSSW